MVYGIVCNKIDEYALEIIRDEKDTVILNIWMPWVIVINPNVDVNGCPLITYVAHGDLSKYHHVLGDICRNDKCGSFFTSDVSKHMQNGYLACPGTKDTDTVIELAVQTLDIYKTYKGIDTQPARKGGTDTPHARSVAGIQKYARDMQAGFNVLVKYDRNKSCCGRIAYVTESAIAVWPDPYPTGSAKMIRIEGCRLNDYVKLENSYAESLFRHKEDILSGISMYDTVDVEYSVRNDSGKLKQVLTDAIILKTNSGDLCIPILAIRKMTKIDQSEKLKWCRENAPEAIKNLPDAELLILMSNAYEDMLIGKI